MRALRQKASSERGASITFALLLFLVCAVISSIVIVAATAVGGRASRMAEMDQRYYAVNSAAELVRDVLEAPTVTVTTGTETTSTVDQDDSTVAAGTTAPLTPLVSIDGTSLVSIDDSLVTTAALNLAEGYADPPAMAAKPIELNATAAGGLDASALTVNITPSLVQSEGKLILDISNADTSKGTYKLRLTFKADRTVSNGTQTSYGARTPQRDAGGRAIAGKYTTDKTVAARTITTVRWKLIDLVTVVAAS